MNELNCEYKFLTRLSNSLNFGKPYSENETRPFVPHFYCRMCAMNNVFFHALNFELNMVQRY